MADSDHQLDDVVHGRPFVNHIVALPIVIGRAVHVDFLEVFETSLISLETIRKSFDTQPDMDLRTHVELNQHNGHANST